MVQGRPPLAYQSESNGVTIRISPRFLHDESDPARSIYFWSYTVEIENVGSRTWTLRTRHWRIVDALGRQQAVDGEGVVGQTPRLAPGESFRYTSGVPLGAPSGMMGGHFGFESDDGQETRLAVPTFSLDSPFDTSRPT